MSYILSAKWRVDTTERNVTTKDRLASVIIRDCTIAHLHITFIVIHVLLLIQHFLFESLFIINKWIDFLERNWPKTH